VGDGASSPPGLVDMGIDHGLLEYVFGKHQRDSHPAGNPNTGNEHKECRVNKAKAVFSSPIVKALFWISISVLLIFLALKDVKLADVWVTLLQANGRYVVLALISVAINVWAKALRWWVLLNITEKKVGFSRVIMALMTGQTLNWFFPGRVGDLSRAYVVGSSGPGRSFTLGTIAVEKVLDTLFYALIFITTLFLLPLPSWINDSGYTLTVLTLVLVLGMLALSSYPEWFVRQVEKLTFWLPERERVKMVARFQAGIASLKVLRSRSQIFKLTLLSALVWGTAAWTPYIVAQALSLPIPIKAALVVLVVLQAGISLPGVPGRIGVFQYLCILALALFNVNQADSLTYGILLQAIILLPTTMISLLFFGALGLGPVRIKAMKAPESKADTSGVMLEK